MNEIYLQLVTYHLALFPLMRTLKDEEIVGWFMIGTLGAVFICNILIMISVMIKALKRKLLLRKLRKQSEAKIAAKQKETIIVVDDSRTMNSSHFQFDCQTEDFKAAGHN